MRVLVTGDRGKVGVPVAEHLRRSGYEVTGFDLADGADVLDLAAVSRAALGCEAIVHLAALAHDTAGRPEQIMAVNVLGTWHVLLAAEAAGVSRVICFSSAQALGIAEGEQLPDYFPVDDDHPRRAMRPYGLSKVLAEDLCEGFTARTGIATVCLRPVAVWDQAQYARVADRWRAPPVSPRPRPASTSPPGSPPQSRSPTRAVTAPIPGPPSSTAQPPPLRSASGPPADGPSAAQTRTPSHNARSDRRVRSAQGGDAYSCLLVDCWLGLGGIAATRCVIHAR